MCNNKPPATASFLFYFILAGQGSCCLGCTDLCLFGTKPPFMVHPGFGCHAGARGDFEVLCPCWVVRLWPPEASHLLPAASWYSSATWSSSRPVAYDAIAFQQRWLVHGHRGGLATVLSLSPAKVRRHALQQLNEPSWMPQALLSGAVSRTSRVAAFRLQKYQNRMI